MSSPWKHPDSSTYYLRTRVPKDLAKTVRGRKITLPVADRLTQITAGQMVKVSLQTKDVAEAKERHRKTSAALDDLWTAIRSGPKPLTFKQIQALAGEFYRLWADTLEDNPGAPSVWDRVLKANTHALEGGKIYASRLAIPQEITPEVALERRFGPFADLLLAKHKLETDARSRLQLLVALKEAGDQAAEKLKRNAQGDYRPDPDAERFPPVKAIQPATSEASSQAVVSLKELFKKWKIRRLANGGAERSARRWEPIIEQFTTFIGHDDALKITRDDIIAWRESLYDQGRVSASTFKKVNRAALSAVFELGVDLGKLNDNPVKTVKPDREKKVQTRPKGFTDAEASLILTKASQEDFGPDAQFPWSGRLRRWVPWICAYTGARISEITQLRKEDIVIEDGVHCIRITPDAGSVKSGHYRIVPLHSHLIDQGFLRFVEGAKRGYLFIDPTRTGEDLPGRTGSSLGRWIKSEKVGVDDPNVQPNHAWRHRFRNLTARHGIDSRTTNHITGNAQGNVGQQYGDPEVRTMHEAIEKLPRYEVAGL